jgi:hypothetical protein
MRDCCSSKSPSGVWRKLVNALGWIVPGAVLALLPKCPMCLVGYAALLGLGLSATAATYVRDALLVSSVVALTSVVTWTIFRESRRREGK